MPILYITGNDASGRSAVIERRDVAVEGGGHLEALRIDPGGPVVPEGSSDVMLLDSPTPPGGSVYNLWTWVAGQRTPMHRTITTDLDIVLQGSLDMELETETVTLHAGDSVILPGTAHAWISGPDGAIVMYGLLSGIASGADVDRHRGRLM